MFKLVYGVLIPRLVVALICLMATAAHGDATDRFSGGKAASKYYSCSGLELSLQSLLPAACETLKDDIAYQIVKCPADLAAPPECVEDPSLAADVAQTPAPSEQQERYACDVQFFKDVPAECTLVYRGGKTNIIDCPAHLHPGMLCKYPTAEDLAAHGLTPLATAPSPPAPQVNSEPALPLDQSTEKPGWFSWLWGTKKPAAGAPSTAPEPATTSVTAPSSAPATPTPAAAALPQEYPATTVAYAGKDLVLVAPPGMCFMSEDNQLLKVLVENVLYTGGKPTKILAGYKECNTPETGFRSVLGIYYAPDVTFFDYQDQQEAEVRGFPAKSCSSDEVRGGNYISPSGSIDDRVAAILEEKSRKVLADEIGTVDVAILGLRRNACNVVSAWGLGKRGKRTSYMNLSSVFVLKERLLLFSDNTLYSGVDPARKSHARVNAMFDRLWTLNGGK